MAEPGFRFSCLVTGPKHLTQLSRLVTLTFPMGLWVFLLCSYHSLFFSLGAPFPHLLCMFPQLIRSFQRARPVCSLCVPRSYTVGDRPELGTYLLEHFQTHVESHAHSVCSNASLRSINPAVASSFSLSSVGTWGFSAEKTLLKDMELLCVQAAEAQATAAQAVSGRVGWGLGSKHHTLSAAKCLYTLGGGRRGLLDIAQIFPLKNE